MKVAILGLGIIGAVWARNLMDDGVDVRPWNRTKRDFPGEKATAAEAVEGADFIVIVVADPPAVQQVLDEIQPVLRAGQTVLQASTISAAWTRTFAAQVQAAGAAFLEAPFTGSKPAAEKRQTVFYIGGDPDVFAACRPLLDHISRAALYVGPLGSASSLKLAMNLNLAQMAQALSESLTLARAEGISDDTYFAALRINVGHSGLAELKEPKLRDADFAPQFSIKHMGKDLRLAAETAAAHPAPPPGPAAAAAAVVAGQDAAAPAPLRLPQLQRLIALYDDAQARGWGDDDFISLVRLIQAKT
ncbi:NAD(P)-dependent oxidoreductase [Verrucomicrobia bacterium LW23]|nr:NAD(P)-dependent oxidoreductase [Verrucomicrobia bacterium LW23]